MTRGPKPTAIGIIVKEYLKKYRSLSSRKIGDLLCTDYPLDFKTSEYGRRMVRYYRGASGDQDRNKMAEESYLPRFSVPSSDETVFDPYVIPIDAYPIIAGGDVHIPYHDQDALEIFLERAYSTGANTLLMAGDWLDMYQVSRWNKDPNLRSVKEELDIFNSVLDMIQRELPDTKLIFKIGNHEARFDNYLMQNAPDLYGLEQIRLKNILKLADRGIDLVADKQLIKYGHLHILHGHEYVFSISNPVNPARGLYNRAKKSSLCFHHHQTSEHTEPSINGDVDTCWSVGCLCGLRPDYMPYNKWNHGFVEINGNDDGEFLVENRRIVNYKIM